MWTSIARALGACVICLAAGPLPAQPAAPSVLDLDEALARTLKGNPELVAAGFQIEAAEGRVVQAGLAPRPELGIAVQDAFGTGDFGSVHSAETTATVGWFLERGLRAHIVEAARAGVALRVADAEIARFDTVAETARRYVACLAFQARLASATRAVERARTAVTISAERVGAGRSPQAELSRAEAELARAELRQEDYEHELLGAYHRLSAQWGVTAPEFSTVAGTLDALPVLEPVETLLARVEESPDLARFASQRRVAETELRVEELRGRPTWHVSAGLRRFEATDDWALVGGLTIPLALRNRNQGRIAEARADLARTDAERTASHLRLETTLFVMHQALNHHIQVAERLRADVIPRLELALEDSRRAYELGRYGYSEWRIVETELLVARDELLDASASAHELLIEIERLTGVRAPLVATPRGSP